MTALTTISTETTQTPAVTYTRVAGALYLIIIVCGLFGEIGVRSNLIVQGDSESTAANIIASSWLFRLGFVADSIMLLSDVAVAILLHALFKTVNMTWSLSAAAFRLTQAAILGANLLTYYAAMLLLNGDVNNDAFSAEQLNSLVLLFLNIHSHGYDLGLLFFGISNLILGALIIRSVYFPVLLGYGLIAAGMVYLVGSFTRFLAPSYISMVEPAYVVPLIAELAFCLWLLLKGRQIHR